MILVTGATGNVGGEVVRQLASAGQPVRALVREAAPGAFPATVEIATGDLDDPSSLVPARPGLALPGDVRRRRLRDSVPRRTGRLM